MRDDNNRREEYFLRLKRYVNIIKTQHLTHFQRNKNVRRIKKVGDQQQKCNNVCVYDAT